MIKKMYRNIFILFLIFIIFMLSKGLFAPKTPPLEILKIDTVEVEKDTTIYRDGKLILKDTTIFDTIIQLVDVDTQAILKNYFAKNVYKDTIKFKEGFVALTDTISQNQIASRVFSSSIKQKTITRELRIPYPPTKAEFYWGVMTTKKEDTYGFGGGIIFKAAKNGIFQVSYTSDQQIQIGYYSKIF